MSLPGVHPEALRETQGIYDSLLDFFLKHGTEDDAWEEFRRVLLIVHGPKIYFLLFKALTIEAQACNRFRSRFGLEYLDSWEVAIVDRHNKACNQNERLSRGRKAIGFG